MFHLSTTTLIESDHALAAAGRELLPEAVWLLQDYRSSGPLPPHDLVIASYSLAEQDDPAQALRLWTAARQTLVIVEPGTPPHFAFLREVRARLLAAGAPLAAPCPGEQDCPLLPHDWCHFAARVERSSFHRRLKEGALGYEDEKFSYLIFSREPVQRPAGRILRRPQHRPGLVTLEICRGERTETARLSKSDRERFRAARKAGWGGAWE
jgi:ribosomal protein RSM22 (predicted rRNA methylase)